MDKRVEACIIFRLKTFDLNGPDSWQFYWHDLRKEPLLRDASQAGTAESWFGQDLEHLVRQS
jgi:hypothetical protein